MTKYKKQELRIVLGGFIAVLVLTLILGYAITSKKSPEKVPDTTASQTAQSTSSTAAPTEETESTTDETTTETTSETTTEEQTEEQSTVDGSSSPFNPKVITVDNDNWELTLLNTSYKLPDGYSPDLVPAVPGSSEYLDKRVQPYYEQMYNAAKSDGIILTPYSGYRSFATQTRLYTNKVNSYKSQGLSNYEAEIKASHWSMLPGCSEHNFGVAMDICNTNDDFNLTEQYAWLIKHAEDYGFIERYKGEKTEYTGVAAEPWHWRYVGVENAKKINASGLCLEEYLGKTD